MLSLTNISNSIQVIENNERIAQGIFIKYLGIENDNADKIREGGIGSTDIVYSKECPNSTKISLVLF